MKKLMMLSFAAMMAVTTFAGPKTKVVAHRGYWKIQGSAQNSLTSYREADRVKCWGSEIDVWITADDVLVVNHDPGYKGHVIETSTYDELKNLTLANGEKLPTLEEYLNVVKKGKCKLVLELKTHKSRQREDLCVDKVLEMINKFKLQKRTDYITFSFEALKRFIQKVPKSVDVYYLSGNKSAAELLAVGCRGIDYHENVLLKAHPEWMKEFKDAGFKINIWTVDNPEMMRYYVDQKVDFITTNQPEVLQQVIKEAKADKKKCKKGAACEHSKKAGK